MSQRFKNWLVNKIVGPLPEDALRAMPKRDRDAYLASRTQLLTDEFSIKRYREQRLKRERSVEPMRITFFPIIAIVTIICLFLLDIFAFVYVFLKICEDDIRTKQHSINELIINLLSGDKCQIYILLSGFISAALNILVLCGIGGFHNAKSNYHAFGRGLLTSLYGACHVIVGVYLFDRKLERSGSLYTLAAAFSVGANVLGILGIAAGVGLKRPFLAVFIGSSDSPKKYLATGISAGSLIGALLGNLVLLLDFVQGNESKWYHRVIAPVGGNLVPMIAGMYIGKFIGFIYAIIRSAFYERHEARRIIKAQASINLQNSIKTLSTQNNEENTEDNKTK